MQLNVIASIVGTLLFGLLLGVVLFRPTQEPTGLTASHTLQRQIDSLEAARTALEARVRHLELTSGVLLQRNPNHDILQLNDASAAGIANDGGRNKNDQVEVKPASAAKPEPFPALKYQGTQLTLDGQCHLLNMGTSECLDDHKQDGRVGRYDCMASDPQQWRIDSSGQISRDGRCLDAGNAGKIDVQLKRCDGSSGQKWKFSSPNAAQLPGWVTIQQAHGHRCLAANASSEFIQVQPCSSACPQLWFSLPSHSDEASVDAFIEQLQTRQLKPSKKSKVGGKLFCWVLTMPKSHNSSAKSVQETWVPGCDEHLFMSSGSSAHLQVHDVSLSGPESRDMIWEKTLKAWRHTAEKYLHKFDWFLKADDDTFVMTDNLRSFLSKFNASLPYYFGHQFKTEGVRYNSGGGGYVLSRAALQLLMANASAFTDGIAEDFEIARSLKNVGVDPSDTRDRQGGERFFPFTIADMLSIRKENDPKFWFWEFNYYPHEEGPNCCSTEWVTSHYVPPQLMRLYRLAEQMKCNLIV
eukprot:m.23271 g.23271  ORF g.23271 m.23271 type:complete len:524 (-) comp13124_c0_seq1:22-1593(-)